MGVKTILRESRLAATPAMSDDNRRAPKALSAALINPSPLAPGLIGIGIYPNIAARRSGHVIAFSIRRPIIGPPLRAAATDSGYADRHPCSCRNDGQACNQKFGRHPLSRSVPNWKNIRMKDLSTSSNSSRICSRCGGKYHTIDWFHFYPEVQEAPMLHAKQASSKRKPSIYAVPVLSAAVGLSLSLASDALAAIGRPAADALTSKTERATKSLQVRRKYQTSTW